MGVLLLNRDAISVFYSPSLLGCETGVETDHLVHARRLDVVFIHTKEKNMYFYYASKAQSGCERKQKPDKYLDLTKELKRKWNMKFKMVPIAAEALGTLANIWKRLDQLQNQNQYDHKTTKTSQDIQRSTGVLRRLAVT